MIGIFGGTFDPIHIGHLRTAIELRDSLGLDHIKLLPCHLPAHRDRPGATSEQRIAMLELAVEGLDTLVIDKREAERESPSYSVDTLASLHWHPSELSYLTRSFCSVWAWIPSAVLLSGIGGKPFWRLRISW